MVHGESPLEMWSVRVVIVAKATEGASVIVRHNIEKTFTDPLIRSIRTLCSFGSRNKFELSSDGVAIGTEPMTSWGPWSWSKMQFTELQVRLSI